MGFDWRLRQGFKYIIHTISRCPLTSRIFQVAVPSCAVHVTQSHVLLRRLQLLEPRKPTSGPAARTPTSYRLWV